MTACLTGFVGDVRLNATMELVSTSPLLTLLLIGTQLHCIWGIKCHKKGWVILERPSCCAVSSRKIRWLKDTICFVCVCVYRLPLTMKALNRREGFKMIQSILIAVYMRSPRKKNLEKTRSIIAASANSTSLPQRSFKFGGCLQYSWVLHHLILLFIHHGLSICVLPLPSLPPSHQLILTGWCAFYRSYILKGSNSWVVIGSNHRKLSSFRITIQIPQITSRRFLAALSTDTENWPVGTRARPVKTSKTQKKIAHCHFPSAWATPTWTHLPKWSQRRRQLWPMEWKVHIVPTLKEIIVLHLPVILCLKTFTSIDC